MVSGVKGLIVSTHRESAGLCKDLLIKIINLATLATAVAVDTAMLASSV
jgi:hypothetical protein